MKNTSLFRRILSVVLVVAMVLSVMVPSISAEQIQKATGTSETRELDLVPIDPGTLESRQQNAEKETNEETAHRSTDVVRVSIVLEKASTLDAGFKAENYTRNPAARAYRAGLREEQKAMTAKIEKVIGGKLDVKWNLTLAANNISANVLYGQIEAIKAIDGVKDVFLENRYEPQVDAKADEPNNGAASYMIGSNITWANGYTGAGSKVAVIDTGIDSEHQSFSGEALEYALAQTAEEKGMSYDEYVASLNLLTADKIDAVKGELNAAIGSGAAAYRNTKIAYGYNYVDKRVDYIEHMQDSQGEHGSHVEGIAAANRFIKVDGEFVPALQAVGTQGVAPDAQIVVMKVFGIGGGAYDSDYIVAIEDAIVLGCDSANLSLGSGSTGFSFSSGYEDTMNKLVENGTVVAFSAGNSGMWYDTPNNSAMGYPYLYIDDVNYATGGSPGSFTNSLTVASVDNMGQTGRPLVFGDRHVFYSETSGYGNSPIATIAGQEYEYVLVDGPGVDDNDHVGQAGDQFMAIGSEVLTGKIAMCYRGSSSFFAKANAAAAQGAVGVIIINNADGVINMNLTGYNYTAPAVSILKADGDAIKAASEKVEGDQEYYTGTMSISGEIEVQVPEVTDTVSVSSFSSYGPAGTLGMKPEILAPGGSIYSVWGANASTSSPTQSHTDYEVMSGTSMASPQVAGMAAVMGQYIRDNDLCAKTGLSQRQLINSLLMSTAHPVFDEDGEYWSTFRVGSGLGNVADATAAKSYILMDENATLFPDTAKDGKVKVELGDDPDCIGEYEYSFTVYPMEGSKSFTLRTDLFTQAVAGNAGYGLLQYTGTMGIGSVATYEVNGEVYEDTYALDADVNMDGETDEADAQAILDKLTGELAEDAAFDEAAADVDGDKAITTVDARLILESAATPVITITEPTKVTVNLKIDEGWKALLLGRYFTKGFFVEGYTYVDPVADEEGVLDVVHSIPILGYCGSWTDPAMLDRSSAIDVAYGTAKEPYVTTSRTSNYMSVKDADGDVSTYMGNPYMIEDEFPVERLALNSETTINAFNYLNIRNVATLGFAIQDAEGKVLFAQATPTQKYSAYYYVNGGTWQNTTPANYNVGKKLASAGVQEGDVITVGFYALPEYYGVINAKNNGQVAATGSLDTAGLTAIVESGILGDGAGIKYTVTVDNTAPEVKGALMDLITGDITIRAQDNRYVAYVAVMNKSGSKVYMEGVPEQTGPNELVEVPLELPEGVTLPKGEVVLLVGDYAGNESAFKVNLGGNGEEEDNGGLMIGFVPEGSTAAPGSGNRAWEIDKDALWYNHSNGTYAGLSNYANVNFTVTAAEYVDGYVFMAADDGNVYAAELGALDEASRVGSAIDAGYVYDMAFNYTNNNLYLLGENNTVYKMHLITGELTEVAVVTLPGATGSMNRLAIDDNGVFYTANDGNTGSAKLYKFTLEDSAYVPENPNPGEDPDPEEPVDPPATGEDLEPVVAEITAEQVGTAAMGVYNKSTGGSMAWDHDNDLLYLVSNWNATQDYDHYLWTVDTTTGVAAKANSVNGAYSARLYGSVRGLFIVPGNNHLIYPTDIATGMEVEPGELNLFKGQTAELTVTLFPWTLTNKDVTWESADPAIATVKDGVVTGVEEGETVVTVTSAALSELGEPHVIEIPVTVSMPPEAEIRGIIWDENGKGQASVFNSNATQEWTALSEVGQLRWGALVGDTVYGSTDDTMYAFDADTYEVTQLGGIVSMWIPSDACELPEDFVEAFAAMGNNVGSVIGPNNNGTYLTMLDPEAGSLIYFNLGDTVFGSDPMATFTGAGRGVYDDGESTDENGATFYGLTESGELYLFTMNHEGSIMWTDLGNTGLDLSGVADATNSVWASTVYDAENEFLYLSLYNGADEYAHLYAIDVNDLSRVGETGNFNADVWPVTGLYEYEPATDLVLKVKPESLVLFEGETAELNIKVKLGETNEYTVEVADENVCTFADGVVTAVKEGETTITVTTVDVNEAGEHLSKVIPVKVKGFKSVDIFVNGQVTDENGARFTKISLDGAVVSKKGVEAPGNVTSGTRAGDLYVADIGGSVNILDAATYEPNLDWNKFDTATYAQYPALDFANYPTYRTTAGVDVDDKVVMTTSVGWLVRPDYYGWNISSFIADMAGVAFGGLEEMEDGTLVYDYYILGADGTLYFMAVDFVNGRRTDPQAILNTGIVLANPTDASMTFVATAKVNPDGSISEEEYENAGLVIADNGSKKLWYLDFMAEEEDDVVGLVGIMDVENVSGLYGTFDELDSVADIQGIEPFDPGPEPEDPGTYPEPAEGFYNPIVTWDFNDTVDGWTFFDRDADGNNWIWTPESDYSTIAAYEGAGMILSQSYINGTGALNPDNFAISPAINLADYDNANISFWAKGQDASYANEVFAVYAGTSAEVGEMVKISEDFTATGAWTQYTASLADFAGEEEVYVAIRHYSCTDMYFLDVDYVEVLTEGGEAPPEPVAPVYEWSFENTTDLTGWTLLSNDSDTSTWERYSATGVATPTIPETGYVLSATYNSAAAVDDLAITPALDFSELSNATLSFWVMKNSTTWNENYAVYAGTSANFEEMEELVPETATVNAWTNVTVDLADYAGEEEVYIAFRHTAADNQFRIYLDAVEITTIEEEEPAEPFETVLWDFEDETLDDQWTIVDVDGQSSFEINTTANAYSGGRALYCYYGDHPNDWAISPAVDLSNAVNPELSVYGRRAGSSDYYESFQLYAGTSTNVDEMTKVLDTTELSGAYSEYVADLAEFAGEPEVYVAVRYCNSPDMYGVYFDDVSVREHTGEDGNAFKHPAAPASFKAVKLENTKLGDGYGRLDIAKAEVSNEMMRIGETANEVTGGTNAIRGELTRTPVRKPVDETVTENGTVQIVLTEDVAVTNGLFTVTYDAEALSFVDAVSTLPYKSIHHEIVENKGVITIAYASLEEIAAGETLATLNFTYPEQTVDTTVVVKTLERNDEVAVEEEELEIEVKFDHVHDYGEPEWTWTEDFSAATATFTCECGDVQTVEAVVTTETVDASCTEAGKTVYTAVAVFEETEYTDVKEVEIPATGHTPAEPVIENEVAPTCTEAGSYDEVVYCSVCGEELSRETKTVDATGHTPAEPVIENEVAPTCTEAGSYDEVVYCSVCGEELSRETKTVDAIGHAYGEPEWTWTEENTASAKFVCANCGDEQIVEAVVSSETFEPTCTEAGKTVYTAVATFEEVEYTDTKEIEGDPALGHSYGEPEWTWTEDFTATAKFVCSVCGDELVLDAEVSAHYYDTKTVYTAVVTLDETEYTDVVEGPALDPNTYILTDVLKDGDQVVIYNPGYGKGVSNADFSAEQPSYRAGVDVVPEGDKIVNPEDAIVWTVQYVYDAEGNAIGVNFVDAEGHKLSMDEKGLELDKANDVWEIRDRSEEDFTKNLVNVNAAPGSQGDPKAMEWYAKYGEFSTHYLKADDDQFIFELYAKVELEPECKIPQFVDLEEYPHGTPIHEAIEWAFTHEPQITAGTDDTHFMPEKELDRKTAMTFLYAAAGKPDFDVESAAKTFSDVPAGKWYTKAILWAANQNPAITSGNPDGTFGINTVCNTAHMLTFLFAQQGRPEYDETAVPEGYVADGKWYTAAAKWAYAEGIYRAEGDKFNQNVPCTRATTVLYIYRALTGNALAE